MDSTQQYNFTELAVQLNEPEDGVAPTDSRLRPDQRLMEEAKWDEANQTKIRLEEKQRAARKKREQEYALKHPNSAPPSESSSNFYQNNSNSNSADDLDDMSETDLKNLPPPANTISHDPEPAWFKKSIDPYTQQPIHIFKNDYWDCKANKDWSRCPNLF